jgi:hypothetical protein
MPRIRFILYAARSTSSEAHRSRNGDTHQPSRTPCCQSQSICVHPLCRVARKLVFCRRLQRTTVVERSGEKCVCFRQEYSLRHPLSTIAVGPVSRWLDRQRERNKLQSVRFLPPQTPPPRSAGPPDQRNRASCTKNSFEREYAFVAGQPVEREQSPIWQLQSSDFEAETEIDGSIPGVERRVVQVDHRKPGIREDLAGVYKILAEEQAQVSFP